MAIKGPDIHLDYGYAYPLRVVGDSTCDWTTGGDHELVFRVGVPGPVEGVVATPLIETSLTVTGIRAAAGTVPSGDTELDPGTVYGYHVEDVTEGCLVVHGRCVVERAVGRG